MRQVHILVHIAGRERLADMLDRCGRERYGCWNDILGGRWRNRGSNRLGSAGLLINLVGGGLLLLLWLHFHALSGAKIICRCCRHVLIAACTIRQLWGDGNRWQILYSRRRRGRGAENELMFANANLVSVLQ